MNKTRVPQLTAEEVNRLQKCIKAFLRKNPESDESAIIIDVLRTLKERKYIINMFDVLKDMVEKGKLLKNVTETYSNIPKVPRQEVY